MLKYTIKRLLLTIPVLLGVAFLVFSILALTPGDPGSLILGMNAKPEDIAALNHEFGYDQPFFTRFVNYIKDIVTHFDFGTSYRTRQPVVSDIMTCFPYTLRIAVLSMIFSSVIGIALGILSAVKQYSWVDNISTSLSMFFASMPGFWLGLMLMIIFSLKLGWLPSNGIGSWKNYVLPLITLTLGGSAGTLRLTRTTMLEVINQDYVRTARAKGAPRRTVIWLHAFKNALLPIITSIGMGFGADLGGAVVIETVFSIPGLGTLIVTAIRQKNVPVVMGGTLFLAAMFCLIVLVVDILYAYLDPRVKTKLVKAVR